jgi:hypothetical protein
MARTRNTGDGEPYSDAEEARVADAIEAAFADTYGEDDDGTGPDPTGADVEAQIEWAGTVDNNGRGGVRFTRLDGLNTGRLREAAKVAAKASRQAERGPLHTYQAKGWEAQWRQITGSNRGAEAMKAAGLDPSKTTMLRWLSGDQGPSKANQERISKAYDELRNPARGTAREANGKVAGELTAAVKARYGAEVRFRDIRSWTWRR